MTKIRPGQDRLRDNWHPLLFMAILTAITWLVKNGPAIDEFFNHIFSTH